jgi:ferredoxin
LAGTVGKAGNALSCVPMNSPSPFFMVTVEPGGERFAVPEGQTLLQAAWAAGVALPRLCRNGTCRECLCQMVAGTVRYRIEWPGLSADEKAEGCVLPCVAEPASDIILRAPRRAPASIAPQPARPAP